jgi:small ligand-binding sensory domain FIST
MPYAHAHAAGPDWQSICETLVEQLGRGTGAAGVSPAPASDLALIYADHTLAADGDRILEYLRRHTGIAHWAGTVGMGVCSTAREVYDQPSVAVLITDLGNELFLPLPPLVDHPSLDDFLKASAAWRARHDACFAIVHGDPQNARLPRLIEDLADSLDGGFLAGGLTSSEGLQVQFADRAVGGGLSGVLLAGDVPVVTGISQGCSLIGEKHVISACQRNIIAEIDGRPALEVLKQDIGEVLARDLNRIGGYIFAALPIRGSDTGDYLVRNLIGVDPGQGLLAIGDLIEVGMAIQFAKRDAQSARDDLEHMLLGVKSRLPGPAKGATYHTCLGRGRHLFGEDSAELRLIAEQLGDVPLVGFYANGEISHRRLYGYTGVLTIFC